MNGAGKVYIFGIHEIAFIKEPGLHDCGCAEQHKTAAQVRSINGLGQVEVTQFVPFIAFLHPCGR